MKPDPSIRPSDSLRHVRYEIRGRLARRAHELERQGYEIVSLNIGNPKAFGFRTPETMRLAMIENLAEAEGYCHQKGIFPAREAVVMQQQARGVTGVTAEEVFIGNGVSELIDLVLRALLNSGDEVLVPSPDYPLWTAAVTLNGGRPVHYPCRPENGFVPDPEELARLVTPRTRAIVIINPNNPTGAVYPPDTIEAFARLCRERGLFLILDETYRDFIAGRPHGLIASGDYANTLIYLYSFPKSYCIPGHRLGALVASPSLQQQVGKILDTLQICAPRTAQDPVAWAIDGLADWREANRLEIARRGDAFRAAFQGLNGWKVDSMGAYFAFLRHPFPGRPAAVVVKELVEKAGVLCLPGPYFGPGQEGHMRVAFANAGVEQLRALRERFSQFPG